MTFGGAVACNNGEVVINHSNFSKNVAHCHGGAIFGNRLKLIVSHDTFQGNFANMSGGAICFSDYFELTSCHFQENTARIAGGALYLPQVPHFHTKGTMTFKRNIAGLFGGAIYCGRCLNIFTSFVFDDPYMCVPSIQCHDKLHIVGIKQQTVVPNMQRTPP